jgi:hypothetical protein
MRRSLDRRIPEVGGDAIVEVDELFADDLYGFKRE